MKKYFLFFAVFCMTAIILPNSALARKKYRYIKREHGVKFEWRKPSVNLSNGLSMNIDLEGAYTYNWKGMLEAGPYFGLQYNSGSRYNNKYTNNPAPLIYNSGLILEYNIIKNRGRRKWIPALGLKFGVNNSESILSFETGAHGALKIFVGKRTPFTIAAGYRLVTPFQGIFQQFSHNVDISMGFSYYFDFY